MPVRVRYFHSCLCGGPLVSLDNSGPTTSVGLKFVILVLILASLTKCPIKNGWVSKKPFLSFSFLISTLRYSFSFPSSVEMKFSGQLLKDLMNAFRTDNLLLMRIQSLM